MYFSCLEKLDICQKTKRASNRKLQINISKVILDILYSGTVSVIIVKVLTNGNECYLSPIQVGISHNSQTSYEPVLIDLVEKIKKNQ